MSEDQVQDNLTFSLQHIMLHDLRVKSPSTVQGEPIFKIGRIAIANPPTNLLRVGIQIQGYFGNDPEDYFGILEAHCIFIVNSLNLFADKNDQGQVIYNIPQSLLETFFSISYSTSRGIWFAKGMGTVMQVHFPPLVSPSEMALSCEVDNDPWSNLASLPTLLKV